MDRNRRMALRALNRHIESVFNPDRKDLWADTQPANNMDWSSE